MKTILCYGDSNTYGLKSDLLTRYARDERWTGILQNNLGSGYYVIEEGLGGRTTVWDDPIENYKNGKKYLMPCLDSHKPLDLVIVMLGINDLKCRFSLSSFDVAAGMENILREMLKSDAGIDFTVPKVLLVAPVPIKSVGNIDLDRMLPGAEAKSKELAPYYEAIAKKYGIDFLNPADEVEVDCQDGIHFTLNGHAKMAKLIEQKVRGIFALSVD